MVDIIIYKGELKDNQTQTTNIFTNANYIYATTNYLGVGEYLDTNQYINIGGVLLLHTEGGNIRVVGDVEISTKKITPIPENLENEKLQIVLHPSWGVPLTIYAKTSLTSEPIVPQKYSVVSRGAYLPEFVFRSRSSVKIILYNKNIDCEWFGLFAGNWPSKSVGVLPPKENIASNFPTPDNFDFIVPSLSSLEMTDPPLSDLVLSCSEPEKKLYVVDWVRGSGRVTPELNSLLIPKSIYQTIGSI